ncbi:MAG: hypothetical protein C0621_09025 [Desulfuromonas sp.]|nr:MAG: hypothetical protein C0621_09025 [Desulfuromonas sp.]
MAVVEVSISPLGTKEPGISAYVAGCVRIARESGISCQLTPMGTVFEGDLDAILAVIRTMQESVFASGAQRVSTSIKIDDRRDGVVHSMERKVQAVETKLKG